MATKKKRVLTKEGVERIRQAQLRRWRKYRREKRAAAKA